MAQGEAPRLASKRQRQDGGIEALEHRSSREHWSKRHLCIDDMATGSMGRRSNALSLTPWTGKQARLPSRPVETKYTRIAAPHLDDSDSEVAAPPPPPAAAGRPRALLLSDAMADTMLDSAHSNEVSVTAAATAPSLWGKAAWLVAPCKKEQSIVLPTADPGPSPLAARLEQLALKQSCFITSAAYQQVFEASVNRRRCAIDKALKPPGGLKHPDRGDKPFLDCLHQALLYEDSRLLTWSTHTGSLHFPYGHEIPAMRRLLLRNFRRSTFEYVDEELVKRGFYRSVPLVPNTLSYSRDWRPRRPPYNIDVLLDA